jgi:predicted metal-dependent hydrolase
MASRDASGVSEPVLHPELTPERRAALVREGVERFRAGAFFAAHEAWEEVWRSTTPEPRDLFQGLVQLAAAFHHLHERGRVDVALRVLGKARRRLERVDVETGGSDVARLDLPTLLLDVGRWESWLGRPAGESPPVPRIAWRAGDADAASSRDEPSR